MIARALLLAAAVSLLVPADVRSDEDAGTRSVFSTGAGNRATALGGAFVAAADDASALLWNPAGLGLIARSELEAVQSVDLGFGVTETYASLALPSWRWGTPAISFRHFGVGGVEQRDERNVLVQGELEDEEFEAAIGYGRTLGEGIAVGGAVKLQHQSLAGFSGSGIGVDLGVNLRPAILLARSDSWAHGLSFGLALRNALAPAIRLDRESAADPAVLRTGLAYRSSRGFLAEVDLSRAAGESNRLHAGLEYAFHPAAAVRVGVNSGRLTAGAELRHKDLGFEYAYESLPLSTTHRAGVSLRFGASTDARRTAHQRRQDEEVERRLAEGFRQREADQIERLLTGAREAHARGDFDGALEQATWVLTLAPDQEEARAIEAASLRERAEGLERAGDYASAALAWERLRTTSPTDSTASAGSERCRRESDARARRSEQRKARFAEAMDAFTAGEVARARDAFRAIVEAEPTDAEAVSMLARAEAAVTRRSSALADQAVRAARAGMLAAAAARLAEAEALDRSAPGVFQAQMALANARVVPAPSASPEPSRPVAAAPRLSDREAASLYERGIEALKARRPDDAVRCWELVWAARPGYREVAANLKREYLARGMELFAAGRLDEAAAAWERVLRIDPADERARGYLARAETQRARSREILGSRP